MFRKKLLQAALLSGILLFGAGIQQAMASETAVGSAEKREKTEADKRKEAIKWKLRDLNDDTYFNKKYEAIESFDSKEAKQLLTELEEVVAVQYELEAVSFEGTVRGMQDVIENYPEKSDYARKYLTEIEGHKKQDSGIETAVIRE